MGMGMSMEMFNALQEAVKKRGPSLAEPGQADYDKEAATAIDESYARLTELLGSHEKVDFRGMAQPFFDRLNQRQVPKAPSPLEAFASSFGSPEGHQSTMQKLATSQAGQSNKDRDLLEMESRILEASINEAMQKGQNSRALALNREQQRLQHHLGRLRAREEQGFKVELEGVKAKQREDQNQAILGRIRERARLSGAGAGAKFEEKVALKLIDAVVKARLARNLLTGKRDLDEQDALEIVEEVSGMLKDLEPVTSPSVAPSTPAAPSTAPKKSRAREIAEGLQKQKGGK